MGHYIPKQRIIEFMEHCLSNGIIDRSDNLSVIYDLDFLKLKIQEIKNAFPKNTFHTTAVKANPLVKILKLANEFNLGAEAASEGELYLAQKAGFHHKSIVFDSPAKTYHELTLALKHNFHVNADSLMEIERIYEIKRDMDSESNIGIRINPQVGYGKIESTSVAGEYSKFGVPLKKYKNNIVKAFLNHKWLNGIHMHIGSQGCETEMLISGFELGLELISEINEALKTQNREVEFFDIGGGLPVSYLKDATPPSIVEYGSKIAQLLKNYKLSKLQLITEFGRYLHANSGFIVSKVEYVKHYGQNNTLIIHAGADILLRECLNPENWHHEILLLNNEGKLKVSKESINYHIAGPLCFANDIVARNVKLPVAEEGDYLIIRDSGGYTFSMWSRYVSRMFPKVIGIENNSYKILRKRETPEDIYKFWSE